MSGPDSATPKRVAKMASSQSLNHLLNFTLPPRQTHSIQNFPRRGKKPSNYQPSWSQEKFVNAQFRFVMNPTESYAVHFADPDISLPWKDIMQILVPRSSASASASSSNLSGDSEVSCPICLSSPAAPRVTKCGHIFCFPCILHYLSASEHTKWARCPICFDSVNEKQLKSVKWCDGLSQEEDMLSGPSSSRVPIHHPPTGSSLRMRLMQRPKITTLALPRSPTWPSDLIPPHQAPFHFLSDVYTYAKFMLATPAYLIADFTTDMDDLENERRTLAGMEDEMGVFFVDSAIEKVRHQIALAAALDTDHLQQTIEKAHKDQQDIQERAPLSNRQNEPLLMPGFPPHILLSASGARFTTHENTTESANGPPTSRQNKSRRKVNPPPPSTSTYYFYQAASGLPIFLHPLEINILFSNFKSYASFPDTITVRTEAVAEGTVNDDLRKRCKYLAHLPEGADVVFVEADLGDVVGEDGLKAFDGPLKMRRAKRREKERKEDRARARAEEREREKERTTAVFIPTSMSPVIVLPTADRPNTPEEARPPPNPPVQVAGAWGTRSFASALHAGTQSAREPRTTRRILETEDDEWGMDAAWHELERDNGGRKKRGSRMVVLGGSGGRRR